jgi:hypothetical protein
MVNMPMPTQCPVPGCAGRLNVTALACTRCTTAIHGAFVPNEFALLPPEHLEFLRLYIKVRGNLKEVERLLGLSYPTIRARFESMLQTLGYEEVQGHEELVAERESILDALENNQITPSEAADKLRKLGKF